ncbi:MAG TPA: DUF2877 domain-containing protein [Actinomycetota bacterium]
MTSARFIGGGAREVLGSGELGQVIAWFPRACYAAFPAGLLVLVGEGVHPGPLYVGIEGDLPRVPVGDPVGVGMDRVSLGGVEVRVGDRTWRGWTPRPEQMEAAASVAASAAEEAGERSLLDPGARAAAEQALLAGDVEAAARALEGRGPGLTPSGDDALAGILFARRLLGGLGAEHELLPIAERAASSPISRGFATWAARGQALAPAHRLVAASVAGDAGGARRAARVLTLVGESSGADFCAGMALGLRAVA